MKNDCHGCEGKGWISIQTAERVSPFLDRNTGQVNKEAFVASREFDVRTCPICSGTGSAKKSAPLPHEGAA